METKSYIIITDAKEVAGSRNPGNGRKIELTELQAEHPLRIGHIRPSEKVKKDA